MNPTMVKLTRINYWMWKYPLAPLNWAFVRRSRWSRHEIVVLGTILGLLSGAFGVLAFGESMSAYIIYWMTFGAILFQTYRLWQDENIDGEINFPYRMIISATSTGVSLIFIFLMTFAIIVGFFGFIEAGVLFAVLVSSCPLTVGDILSHWDTFTEEEKNILLKKK